MLAQGSKPPNQSWSLILAVIWRMSGSPVVVFLLAALSRIGFWLIVGKSDPFIGDDQQDYLSIASNLVARGSYLDSTSGLPTAYRDPGYPAFLSLLIRLGCGDSRCIFALQVAMSAVTGALLVWAATLGAGTLAARITGALYLLLLCLVPYCLLVYPEVLVCLLLSMLLVVIAAWVKAPTWKNQCAVGVVTAATCLTRGALVLGISLLLVAIARETGRAPLKQWLLIGLIPLVSLAGWSTRNLVVVGVFAPNTSGAVNVYLGNNQVAARHPSGTPELDEIWKPLLGLDEASQARRSIELARDFVIQHPGEAARNLVQKLPRVLEFDRMFLGVARHGQFPSRSWRLILLVGGVLVGVSAVVHVACLCTVIRPGSHWLSAGAGAFCLGLLLIELLTVGHSRYSMPGWLISLPAAGLFLSKFKWENPHQRKLLAGVVFVLLLVWAREVVRG